MTISSWPFGAQDSTEAQYTKLFRRLQETGVDNGLDGTDLKVTADGSGLNVKVAAGFAIVRGHAVENDAVITLTIPSPGASTKYHMVVAKLAPSADTITIELIGGTTSIPTPNQTDTGIYEMPLALVTAPASAVVINAANVTQQRAVFPKGLGTWDTFNRPEVPFFAQAGYNTDLAIFEFWNGSSWVDILSTAAVIPEVKMSRGATTSITNADWDIAMDTVSVMEGFTVLPGNWGAMCDTPGLYHVQAMTMLSGLSADALPSVSVTLNDYPHIRNTDPRDGQLPRIMASGLIDLAQDDVIGTHIRMEGDANSSATVTYAELRAVLLKAA